MSKEAALALMTGQPVNNVNPSLITGGMPKPETVETGLTPGVSETPAAPTDDAIKAAPATLQSDELTQRAKREAKRVREEQEFKKRVADLEQKRIELAAYAKEVEEFEALRKTDPVEALKKLKFSETEIFNFLAAQEKKEATPEEIARAAADEQIAKFKEEQANISTQAQKVKEQALVKDYSSKISSAFKANPEKYEYSLHHGAMAEELAIEFATENVKVNGELLTPEQVADAIEEYYEEADRAMSQFKKRQAMLQPKAQQVESKTEPVRTRTVSAPLFQGEKTQPSKTLTNKATATVASTITRKETHEQKKERLITALKNGTYQPK